MTTYVEVLPGVYRDSVHLMQVSRALLAVDGVEVAQLAMATPLNLEALRDMGFDPPGDAGPGDLVIAIEAVDDAAVGRARDGAERALAHRDERPPGPPGSAWSPPPPRTVASAAATGEAGIAFVSVPGQHAFAEAMDALEAGLHVMVFSDNVPFDQEVRLKDEGRRRGLLVMGPDCGTTVIGGVGLGFANVLQPGPVGVVAASGTGAQALTCLLDAQGVGISHCLGVGGRDLAREVGGRATRQALTALDADPATELIVVVSKPPAPEVADRVRTFAGTLATPVILAFVGPGYTDLTGVAEQVRALTIERLDGPSSRPPAWPEWRPLGEPEPVPRKGSLRGLFCGGTLCEEAMAIASTKLGPVASNVPLRPEWSLPDTLRAPGHLAIDFGDDRLTQGRPHPMIDPGPRLDRLAAELADQRTAVVLLDVILGHGAHPDPATGLAEAIHQGRGTEGQMGGGTAGTATVVATIVGTAADPQGLDAQAQALRDAGAHVFLSGAAAARFAASLIQNGMNEGGPSR